MNTLTETTERILIYQNAPEVNRVTQEANARANILNNILAYGLLNNDQIKAVATSNTKIEKFIFEEQLKVNKVLQEQWKAGKKGVEQEYELPENLQGLKSALNAWLTYLVTTNRMGDKYQYLIFIDRWAVDEDELERFFVRRQLKIYVHGESLAEYNSLLVLCAYLEKSKCVSTQVKDSGFLWKRIEPLGEYKYKPRWQYFMRSF